MEETVDDICDDSETEDENSSDNDMIDRGMNDNEDNTPSPTKNDKKDDEKNDQKKIAYQKKIKNQLSTHFQITYYKLTHGKHKKTCILF